MVVHFLEEKSPYLDPFSAKKNVRTMANKNFGFHVHYKPFGTIKKVQYVYTATTLPQSASNKHMVTHANQVREITEQQWLHRQLALQRVVAQGTPLQSQFEHQLSILLDGICNGQL